MGVVLVVGERVVGGGVVGDDGGGLDARVVREHEVDGRGLAAGAVPSVAEVRHGGRADRALLESLGEGGVEGFGAVLVEQADQAIGVVGEALVALGERGEEGVGVWAGRAEPVATAELARLLLLRGERRDMRGVLDDLPLVVAALVAGDLGVAVDHADHGLGSEQRQRLADELVGDRVVVAVEADVGALAAADRLTLLAVEAVLR